MLFEDRFPQSILNDLAAKGHDFRLLPAFHNAVGGGQGIEFTPHGTMLGGADPRRDGVAMGF